MPNRDQVQPSHQAQMFAGVVLAAGGGLLETALMARQAAWLRGPGVICGHQGLAVLHCPGCYVAAALVMGGLALALAGATGAGHRPYEQGGALNRPGG